MGTLLVSIAVVVWVQTQHRLATIAAMVAAVLSLGMLAVERIVVTPVEEIRATLDEVVQQLEANDVDGVLKRVSPDAEDLTREIRAAMRRVEVERISIKRNLKVTLGAPRLAQSAEARFNAVATLNASTQLSKIVVPRFVVVRFRRGPNGWLIKDYESFEPRGSGIDHRRAP